jgi:hypothetical protein
MSTPGADFQTPMLVDAKLLTVDIQYVVSPTVIVDLLTRLDCLYLTVMHHEIKSSFDHDAKSM